MWWLGDWLVFGEKRKWEHGQYDEAIKLGFEWDTARKASWVAKEFETGRRRPLLTWGHHREVAGLDPQKADQLRSIELSRRRDKLTWGRRHAPR
jgi:hypothetical protein